MFLIKESGKVILASIFLYLIFFYPLVDQNTAIYSGKDAVRFHYASRLYLEDNLKIGQYPIWTERIFGGYPIYADLERGYQNLFNIILIYFFGAINSYKFLHLASYLLGSISLYFILKRHCGNFFSFIPASLVYFFSFFTLIHQQHFNFVLILYLLPTILLTTLKFFEEQTIKYFLLNCLLFYFVLTLGGFQIVLISYIVVAIYILSFVNKRNNLLKLCLIQFLGFFLIAQPSLTVFYSLYKESARKEFFSGQGNLDSNNYLNIIYPFSFGVTKYKGEIINPNYVKNENSLYLGISLILIFLLLIFSKEIEIRNYLFFSLLVFLFLNLSFIPIISSFRYWVRAEVIIMFALTVAVTYFLSNAKEINFNKLFFLPLLFMLFPIYFNKNVYFILMESFNQNNYIPIAWVLVFISTILVLLINFKIKKYVIFFVLIFDLLFFNYSLNKNLFMNISELKYEAINNSSTISTEIPDELALFKNIKSSSGYGALPPKNKLEYNSEMQKFNSFKNNLFFNLIVFLCLIGAISYKKVLR